MTCFSELRNNFGKSFNNSSDRNSFLRARDSVWLILKKKSSFMIDDNVIDVDKWANYGWMKTRSSSEGVQRRSGYKNRRQFRFRASSGIDLFLWVAMDHVRWSCSMIMYVNSLQRNLKSSSFIRTSWPSKNFRNKKHPSWSVFLIRNSMVIKIVGISEWDREYWTFVNWNYALGR